jgi:DNA helicase II / ATP-dependent DNA helicase PcrA
MAIHGSRSAARTLPDLRATTGVLIVDEVFDANSLDVDLIVLAGQTDIHTTLIGDPWQALYEFRGAQPERVPQLIAWPRRRGPFRLRNRHGRGTRAGVGHAMADR